MHGVLVGAIRIIVWSTFAVRKYELAQRATVPIAHRLGLLSAIHTALAIFRLAAGPARAIEIQ